MYGMTKSGKLFCDELLKWFLEEGFILSQCQMSIYYKYAPDGTKIVFLCYFYDQFYWYTSETLASFFVDTLRKRFHVNFLGYAHWFISIRIPHMKDNSISVDKAGYDTSIVANVLDTATVKASTNFYKTTLPSDTIFKK